jgi:hypothetical protein
VGKHQKQPARKNNNALNQKTTQSLEGNEYEENMNDYQSKRRIDETALYVFARCEQFIEDYARSTQIPAHVLAIRVGELFYAQTRGQILGVANHMSPLPAEAATGDSITARAMEVALRPYSGAQIRRGPGRPSKQSLGGTYNGTHWTQQPQNRQRITAIGRANIAQAQKRRWAKHHKEKSQREKSYSTPMQKFWATMTAEERSKEIIRRQQVAKTNREVKKKAETRQRDAERHRQRRAEAKTQSQNGRTATA